MTLHGLSDDTWKKTVIAIVQCNSVARMVYHDQPDRISVMQVYCHLCISICRENILVTEAQRVLTDTLWQHLKLQSLKM